MIFSFYGGKSKIIDKYPPSKHSKIVEPFCGAANYSLKYFDREIYLYDKYEVIVNLWKYLIQAKSEDILKLPILKSGENVDNYSQLIKEEKYLIGFNINQGSACPKKTAKLYNGWNENKRKRIAEDLCKIRHWKVELKDYRDIENVEACYFIDPPYEFGGEYYHSSVNNKHIDYNELGEWIKLRKGQVICCENSKANWLPFVPLKEMYGQKYKTTEVIWTN